MTQRPGGVATNTPPPGVPHTPFEDVQGLLIGTALAATGLSILHHAGLVTGQIAGLALLVSHWTGYDFGMVFFVLNLPFYILALRRMGWAFSLKTIASVALLSVMIQAQPHLLTFANVDPLAGAILAGIMIGLGLLSVFRHRASLGGIGILAVYLQDKTGFRAGWTQMAVDLLVFGLAFATLPLMTVLWSLVGAIVLNMVIAINHRTDRYIGM